MASPTNLIADAFEKLNRTISAEDAHKFASTDLEGVWNAVRDIQNIQRKRQSVQNLRRIEPFLKGLEKYSKVIEVLCNGTPFMPYAWAPIKLMLQLASGHRDIFDALLDAYAEIGAALPRFDRYEKVFRENREFQNVLATVYCSILEFHERTYKFFQRRAWSIIFLSLWKDFQSRFANIIESLKKQRDFVDAEAASIDIVEAAESRARLQMDIEQRQKAATEMLERKEKGDRAARLQSSIEWLAVDDEVQETEYERMSRRRHVGTCEWIDGLTQMKNWLKNDTRHPLLWLSGKPGAGKSVMCSHIIHVLGQASELSVCYYFCNSLGAGSVCRQILKTMTLQLLRSHLDLASLIVNEYVDHLLNCSLKQLRILIPQILELVPCTRLVIDGLDECSLGDQKGVLRELQSLCVRLSVRCKILISSRREVYIREKLSSSQHIPLEEREEVQSDIRLYVKYKMTKLRTSNVDLRSEIESLLVKKANGMFLWVRLVIEELRQCYNDADLKERALSLPKGLEKAYDRILDRILDESPSSSSISIAIRILEWMSCSFRPLKSYEILDGISFRLSESIGTKYRPACTTLDATTQMQRDVLDLCKPLIEDGPGNTIDFVHFSAKEYILKQEYRDMRPFIKTDSAHLNISFSCVSYLNTSCVLLPSNCTDQQRVEIVLRGFHGLQFYANQFWLKHVLTCCGLFAKCNAIIPDDLLIQLQQLIQFRKAFVDNSWLIGNSGANSSRRQRDDSLTLNQLPQDVRDLIWEVIEFRKMVKKEDTTLKSLKVIAQEACSKDPTFFSETRYMYQITLEDLLSDSAAKVPSWIDPNQLRFFKEKFGDSAFMCRYTHCSRTAEGFNSMKKRDDHEAAHQRKYRCRHTLCVSYSTGFATKNALSRHNEKYHPAVVPNISLSEGIVLALRQVRKSPAVDNLREFGGLSEVRAAFGKPLVRQQGLPPIIKPEIPNNQTEVSPEQRKLKQENLFVSATDMKICAEVFQQEAIKETVPIRTMSQEGHLATARILKSLGPKIKKVRQALPKWYAITHDDARLRLFCKTYHKIAQQFRDQDMENPGDPPFSVYPLEVDQAYFLANDMMADVAKQFPNLSKSRATDSGTTQLAQIPASKDVPPAQAPIMRQEDIRPPDSKATWYNSAPEPKGIVPERSSIQSPLESPTIVPTIQKKGPQQEDRLTGGQVHNPWMMEQRQQENRALLALQQLLITQIQQQTRILTGWQGNLGYAERFNQVWSIVSHLRLAKYHTNLQQICAMALNFEKSTLEQAPNKETYLKTIRDKLQLLSRARNQIGPNSQAQLHTQAQAQVDRMKMANQAKFQGQTWSDAMDQQSFHSLQRLTQALPLPSPNLDKIQLSTAGTFPTDPIALNTFYKLPSYDPPSLPPGWIAQWDGTGEKYYFVHPSTGMSQWETPMHPSNPAGNPTRSSLESSSRQKEEASQGLQTTNQEGQTERVPNTANERAMSLEDALKYLGVNIDTPIGTIQDAAIMMAEYSDQSKAARALRVVGEHLHLNFVQVFAKIMEKSSAFSRILTFTEAHEKLRNLNYDVSDERIIKLYEQFCEDSLNECSIGNHGF